MNHELHESYQSFTDAFIALFSILNPIGMSAVFLSLTQNYRTEQRRRMAWQVALYSATLLICVFFIGTQLLNFFGISLAALQVSGGFLIFATAWGMLNAETKPMEHEGIKDVLMHTDTDIAFFPLTMPLTAGAGAMAITVTLAAKLDQEVPGHYVVSHLSSVLAICSVCAIVGICYNSADRIFSRLGTTGTNVLTRLTAFILLAISVSIIWRGVMGLLQMLKCGYHC